MTLTRAGDPTGDPGLFGPGSVTWQAHGDPMMWIAGIRALYLQALHPRAVRGVMQNSDFRHDAWGRLMRTAGFVGTTTYGTTEDAERAGARVRRIHRMLGATDPDTGERYGVDEPALLLWVHCAEIGSYLHVLRRSGFPLTDAHADRYLAEHRHSARLVGLDPATVPADRAALAAYFARVRPELAARRRRARGRRLPAPPARAPPPGPRTRAAVAPGGTTGVRLPTAVRARALRQTGPRSRHRHPSAARHRHRPAHDPRTSALATAAQTHPARHGTARAGRAPGTVQTRTIDRHTGPARGGRSGQDTELRGRA
ncbi:oxygenase MpaB family protein [Streptomyces sp. UP1A-1]|nr:oxygenase MpaB family protein [Streptomyces sp. UP1A-1]